MPQPLANLDALIRREDFQIKPDARLSHPQLSQTLKVLELERDSLTYSVLRKPDFQRETANWEPEKIVDLVVTFLDGDLIPAVIMWRAETGNVFVIDGAHRLSAFIAWAHDDYGDGELSRQFFDNAIPPEQEKAAQRARDLMRQSVGSYADIKSAGRTPELYSAEMVKRAKNLSSFAVQVQWVTGDAMNAEASFFKINQKATPIDATELQMIEARRKPNAIAARALIRSGVGHKYWSALPDAAQVEIERLAQEVYAVLFVPILETPIKTLDLPVAGRGYSAASVRLVFDFVNLANDLSGGQKAIQQPADDVDGASTVRYLKAVRKIAARISGDHSSSLGLHPAVYFYGSTGRYQPTAFLTTVSLIKDLEKANGFKAFTRSRQRFEEFLLRHRYFINQTVNRFGSGLRGQGWLTKLYVRILDGLAKNISDEKILAEIINGPDFGYLKERPERERTKGPDFASATKSATFLRDAIEKALRCGICGARIHHKSLSIDHIVNRRDGGPGDMDNAQLAHHYCNSIKDQL